MLNQSNSSVTVPSVENLPGGLPREIWIEIATYLSPQELQSFKLACRDFLAIGQADKVLKPIYNQLYAPLRKLDPSLPENLPEQNYQQQYQSHLSKVSASFDEEMLYLRKHHKDLVQTQIDTLVLTNLPPLKRLEKLSVAMDSVNAKIIKPYINTNSNDLDISKKNITRLPETLLKDANFRNFWQALKKLNCGHNKLSKLNVQGLYALKRLYCTSNQLTTLNIQGLYALEYLYCTNNQLITLNVQGLNALKSLYCHKNQLTTLNVQGLNELQDLWCHNNQLTTLNIQGLNELQELWCHNNQLTTLHVQGLNALQELNCEDNQLTTLPAETVTKFGAAWAAKTMASQKPVKPVTPLYQQERSRKRNNSDNDAQAVTEDTDSFLKQTTKKPRLG